VWTISRLSRWSVAYYEKTADAAKQAAGRVHAGNRSLELPGVADSGFSALADRASGTVSR